MRRLDPHEPRRWIRIDPFDALALICVAAAVLVLAASGLVPDIIQELD